MRRRWFGWIVAGAAVGVIAARALAEKTKTNLNTVQNVDLERYAGRWYEVARLPLFWENKCAANVTATYTLRSDGMVRVANECIRTDGAKTASTGAAKVVAPGKLKVTFLSPKLPFGWGDYWILDLDPDYRWALVGTPNLKHLWVLSRTKVLEKDTLNRLMQEAEGLGFDVLQLIHTAQTSAPETTPSIP